MTDKKVLTIQDISCIKKTVDDENHWYGVKFERALPMLVQELNK